jgi:hypothetical protein
MKNLQILMQLGKNTVKPLLNGTIFRFNENLASAEKYSGHLRFRLRQFLLYYSLLMTVDLFFLPPTVAIAT